MKAVCGLQRRRAVLAALSAFAVSVAVAAPPSLPARNLSVEMRLVALNQRADTVVSAQGSMAVGTRGSTASSGSFTARTSTDQNAAEAVHRVLVLNGASALIRVSELAPLTALDWVFTAQGAGLASHTRWVDSGRGFQVLPRWPGGDALAVLEVQAEAGTAAGNATAPRWAVQTRVQLPLGEWFTLARVGELSGTGAATAEPVRELQVRVTAP